MKTIELINQFKSLFQKDSSFLSEIPVDDLVSCIYIEVYGLRQLYSPEHFSSLEKNLISYSDKLKSSIESLDLIEVNKLLDTLAQFESALPDSDLAQDFIEKANFNNAFLRHQQDNTVIVLGDSHVNFFSGNEDLSFIPIGMDVNSCLQVNNWPFTVLHLGPCLAYKSSEYGSTNHFREKVDWLLESFIRDDAKIICSLGEIDIRAHVFKQSKVSGRTYQEIIDDILSRYKQFLSMLRHLGHEVYCWGPIASQSDTAPKTEDHPRIGSEIERNRATLYFNEELKKICYEEGYEFLSLAGTLIDENLKTNEEYLSKDRFHLGQNAFEVANRLFIEHGLI